MAEEKFMDKYRTMSHRLRGWDYFKNGHYFITIVTENRAHLFGKIANNEMILNPIGQIVYDEFFVSFELRQELYLGAFVLMPNHLHAILILDAPSCDNNNCNHNDMEQSGDFVLGGEMMSKDDVTMFGNATINDDMGTHGDIVGGTYDDIDGGTHGDIDGGTHGRIFVETHGRASLRNFPQNFPQNSPNPSPFQPLSFNRKPHSISSFVAGFKSATVNRIDDWIEKNHYPMLKFNRHNLLWQKNYHDHIIRNEGEYNRIKKYIEDNPAKWCSSHNR